MTFAKMMQVNNPLSIIIAFQSLSIMLGSLIVGGLLKFYGYPDADYTTYSPIAVFIRNWGILGLSIPILWLYINYRIARVDKDYNPSFRQCVLAVFFSLALIIFYILTAFGSAHYDPPLQQIGSVIYLLSEQCASC